MASQQSPPNELFDESQSLLDESQTSPTATATPLTPLTPSSTQQNEDNRLSRSPQFEINDQWHVIAIRDRDAENDSNRAISVSPSTTASQPNIGNIQNRHSRSPLRESSDHIRVIARRNARRDAQNFSNRAIPDPSQMNANENLENENPYRVNGNDNASQSSSATSSQQRALDYSNLRYEQMSGARQSSKLLHCIDEKQLYVYRNCTKFLKQYDCYQRVKFGCPAKVFIQKSSEICFRKTSCANEHNHEHVNRLIDEMKLRSGIKSDIGTSASLAEHIGSVGGGNTRSIFQRNVVTFK